MIKTIKNQVLSLIKIVLVVNISKLLLLHLLTALLWVTESQNLQKAQTPWKTP